MNVFEAIEKGKDFKIKVTAVEDGQVQKAVFAAGGMWRGGQKCFYDLRDRYLFCTNKKLAYMPLSAEEYYNGINLPEAFIPKKEG